MPGGLLGPGRVYPCRAEPDDGAVELLFGDTGDGVLCNVASDAGGTVTVLAGLLVVWGIQIPSVAVSFL